MPAFYISTGVSPRRHAAVATLNKPWEKTRVVHIDDGFDFLGFSIRRMRKRGSNKSFVYTKPSKKAIASIKGRVKTLTYRSTLHHEPGYLMDYLSTPGEN